MVGRKDETLLRVGDLVGQCIGGIPLMIPSERSRTYTSLALGSCSTATTRAVARAKSRRLA
jgi:hypothetical protein